MRASSSFATEMSWASARARPLTTSSARWESWFAAVSKSSAFLLRFARVTWPRRAASLYRPSTSIRKSISPLMAPMKSIPPLALIKGGGGALLMEKIIAVGLEAVCSYRRPQQASELLWGTLLCQSKSFPKRKRYWQRNSPPWERWFRFGNIPSAIPTSPKKVIRFSTVFSARSKTPKHLAHELDSHARRGRARIVSWEWPT